MSRANYSITVCLIFLGLAVLVRTVAIAQRACDVLLPPTSCDYRGRAISPIAIGHTGGPVAVSSVEPTASIYVRPVANFPPVINTYPVEESPPGVAAENPPERVTSRAEHQSALDIASEKQKKKVPTHASPRRHLETSVLNNRSNQRGLAFQSPWATGGW